MPWEYAPARILTALASAARTTAASPHNSDSLESKGRRGCTVHVDVTLDPDIVSIVAKLQALDQGTGVWADIPGAVTAAIAATGHSDFTVYPGIGETANVSVSDIMPAQFRVVVTHTGGTTMTYSVVVEMLA